MDFKLKQHQEPKNIKKELVPLNTETLCLTEATEVLNETSVNISSKFILMEKYLSKTPASFDKKFENISMNSIIEAKKFKLETTFENNVDDIKANHLKIITSLEIKLSAITSKKPYLYSEHLNADLKPWVFLQSPGKSPQFTKNLSSVHLEGNTQLKIRKWWIALRS